MADISLETAQALLDNGKINQKTFDLLAESAKPTKIVEPVVKPSEPSAPVATPVAAQEPTPMPEPTPMANRQPTAQAPSQIPQQVAVQQPSVTPQEPSAPILASDMKPQTPQLPAELQMGNIAKGVNQAYTQIQDATVAGAAAGMKQASQEAAYLRQANDNAQKMEQERLQHEALREQAMKEKTDKLQLMVDQFGTDKIDPNRFWKDRTTGQKILTGVGLFLGAFGQNGNSAAKVVQDAINRDIDAQKSEIERAKTGVVLQNNVLSAMRDQFGDERAAESAARLAALNQVDNQIKMVAAQYRSPMIQEQARQAFAQTELARQKENMEFSKAIQSSPAFMQLDNMGAGIRRMPENVQAGAWDELGAYRKYNKTKDEVSKAYDVLAETRGPLSVLSPDARARRASAEAVIETNTKELFGGKSETEFEIMKKFFPSSSTQNNETVSANKKRLMDKFDSQVSFPRLQEFGLLPKEIKTFAPVK